VNSVPPDEVITPDQVTIVAKDGNKVKVDNPLYRYAFQSRHFEGTQFSEWTTTHRYPETSPTGEINDDVDRLRECAPNCCFAENLVLRIPLP